MSRQQRSRGRVLVVEDNADNRRLAVKVLRRAGFDTVEADGADNLLELIKQHQPDLILIDIELPGQSGLTAVRTVREDPQMGRMPIIAVTAYASPEDRQRCLAAGCTDYLAKPIDINVLVEKVCCHLTGEGSATH